MSFQAAALLETIPKWCQAHFINGCSHLDFAILLSALFLQFGALDLLLKNIPRALPLTRSLEKHHSDADEIGPKKRRVLINHQSTLILARARRSPRPFPLFAQPFSLGSSSLPTAGLRPFPAFPSPRPSPLRPPPPLPARRSRLSVSLATVNRSPWHTLPVPRPTASPHSTFALNEARRLLPPCDGGAFRARRHWEG